jgi:hypothetical protein
VDDWTLLVALLMVAKTRFWSPIEKAWLLDGDQNPFQSPQDWQLEFERGHVICFYKSLNNVIFHNWRWPNFLLPTTKMVIIDDWTRFWLLNYGWLITFSYFTYGNQNIWRQLKPSFIKSPHLYFTLFCLIVLANFH